MAQSIVILDSGVDTKHHSLEHKVALKQIERINRIDDDRNGFIDDISGWNLIENKAETFNYTLIGSFHSDVYKYYRMRAKKALNTASPDDIAWYNKMKDSEEFQKKKEGFTSFIHGTHVAGIAVSSSKMPQELMGLESSLKFYPVKYLGKAKTGRLKAPFFFPIAKTKSHKKKLNHLDAFFKKYIKWQVGKFNIGIKYASSLSPIVNGSFGFSHKGATKMFTKNYKDQMGKKPTQQWLLTNVNNFMKELIEQTQKTLLKYPNTLFVFSAGNSKVNTDQKLHFPSNARGLNIISVAASNNENAKAYFSNWGKKTVDIFAPGLAIESSIPANQNLRVNGTSQAAPYISNIALKALLLAKKLDLSLTIAQLRRIILESSYSFKELRALCASGGRVSARRVFEAIRSMRYMNLSSAIKAARKKIKKPISEKKDQKFKKAPSSIIIDLPELF